MYRYRAVANENSKIQVCYSGSWNDLNVRLYHDVTIYRHLVVRRQWPMSLPQASSVPIINVHANIILNTKGMCRIMHGPRMLDPSCELPILYLINVPWDYMGTRSTPEPPWCYAIFAIFQGWAQKTHSITWKLYDLEGIDPLRIVLLLTRKGRYQLSFPKSSVIFPG